jgi:hypothetical protein
VRYCARSCFALDRLSLLRDSRHATGLPADLGALGQALAGGSPIAEVSRVQLAKIVTDADKRPFTAHLGHAAEMKSAKAAGLFDLPKDRLNDHLASGVDALSPFRQ